MKDFLKCTKCNSTMHRNDIYQCCDDPCLSFVDIQDMNLFHMDYYLHADKSENFDLFKNIVGEDIADKLRYLCYEIKLRLKIDAEKRVVHILEIDRHILDKPIVVYAW